MVCFLLFLTAGFLCCFYLPLLYHLKCTSFMTSPTSLKPLFLPHLCLRLTTGGFFAVTWAHVSHARVSFPLPLSAQLCQPLRSLLALNGKCQFLLTEGLGTSGTAIPQIQVTGRERTPTWAPTLCWAPCMAWGYRTQLLMASTSLYFQVSYWWAGGTSRRIYPSPSMACLWVVRGVLWSMTNLQLPSEPAKLLLRSYTRNTWLLVNLFLLSSNLRPAR